MTIRERLGNPSANQQPPVRVIAAPLAPEAECIHRSCTSVGKIKCGCSSSPEVFTCAEPWVTSGYCSPNDPTPGKFPPEGPIMLPDGTKLTPADDRRPLYNTWPLRNGEAPRIWDVPICSTCPKRIVPPPHIKRIRELGINGNWEPDTGYADIVHVVPDQEHWIQHAWDYAHSLPSHLCACWMPAKAFTDVAKIIDATACRMIITNLHLGSVSLIIDAAKAFPSVKFVVVYHGTQNQIHIAVYGPDQCEIISKIGDIPNLWYGSVEPTSPWGELGCPRFFHWPNTMPFDPPSGPAPTIDPPTLLLAGRACIEKAHTASLLAAALVNKQRPIRLQAAIKSGVGVLRKVAAVAGIELTEQPWRRQVDFRKWVRTNVSITLQPSLCDSFNYVALDSLSQGRPVVGSKTIRYLPDSWQADPNDPADIARVAMMFLDDYDRYSADALRIACEVRDRQRDEYRKLLERIFA
jgi:hypothetical protein